MNHSLEEIELAILGIWQESFKIYDDEKLNLDTDIKSLGADSLEMTEICNYIESDFEIELTLSDLLRLKNVRNIAKAIFLGELGLLSKAQERTWNPPKEEGAFPLTNVQKAFWIGRSREFILGGVSTQSFLEIELNTSLLAIEESVNRLISYHASLRSYITQEGELFISQKVPSYTIESFDLTDKNESSLYEDKKKELQHKIHDVHKWPLFDIVAGKISPDKTKIIFSIDMIIADASSIKIFLDQMSHLIIDKKIEEHLLHQEAYAQYLLLKDKRKETPRFLKDKDYWCHEFSENVTAPYLFLKAPLESVKSPSFKRLSYLFTPKEAKDLYQKAQTLQTTLSSLVLTFYALILNFWSKQDSFVITLTFSNRDQLPPEAKNVIGDFSSLIPLVIRFTKDQDLSMVLSHVKDQLLHALEHRSFDALDLSLELQKKGYEKNLWPIVFTSNMFGEDKDFPIGEVLEIRSQTSQVLLDFQIVTTDKGLCASWDYVEQLFEEDQIQKMFDLFIKSLKDYSINKFQYPIPFSEVRLEELFKQKAIKAPLNVALIEGQKNLTYYDVDKQSDEVARLLYEKGIGEGDLVAVRGDRCCQTIINVLGVLKARAIYVPIDPLAPPERQVLLLKESCVCCYLTGKGELLDVSGEQEKVASDTAYMIFTSGSSGKPKGVLLTHQAVTNTILDINSRFLVTEQDRFLWCSSLCFDLSVYDIFGALSSGASLVIVSDIRNMEDVVAEVTRRGVTIWNSVPSLMELFLDDGEKGGIDVTAFQDQKRIDHPEAFFSTFDHSYLRDMSFSDMASFQKNALERFSQNSCKATLPLLRNDLMPSYLKERRTIRQFSSRPVSFSDFSCLLDIYSQQIKKEGTYYSYASAGGLYPIDLYVFVKEGRVAGLQGGTYFYNPKLHALEVVTGAKTVSSDLHYFKNKEIYQSSSFSIFFVFSSKYSVPKYGGMAYLYAAIDTGIMVGTLTPYIEERGLGLCSIGDLDFEKANTILDLKEDQSVIHCVELGYKSQSQWDEWPIEKKKLRLILLSGDWIPLSLAKKVRKIFPTAFLVSLGGATEGAIWSIYYPVHDIDPSWTSIPYGYPLKNQSVYVLREDLSCCEVGEEGELYIGGMGVALGYFHDEEKTAKAFFIHPLYGRLYRTGDFGVMRQEGWIQFLGRRDLQTKIRGYRVELGEIENHLKEDPFVESSIVIFEEGQLCAFIKGDQKRRKEVEERALKKLPEYMVPEKYIWVDSFPLTNNGKIDRGQLKNIFLNKKEESVVVYKQEVKGSEETINKLMTIWKDITGEEVQSVKLRFADIGMDSIKVVKMANRIRQDFQVEIPLGELFHLQTIELMAFYLDHKAKKTLGKLPHGLSMLRRGSGSHKLYFIHAGSGEIEVYAGLSRHLDESLNVLAIRFEKSDGFYPRHYCLKELALKYVAMIRHYQPKGPYLLGGWCMGGMLAFEVALQLEALGEKVSFLTLISSMPPQNKKEGDLFALEGEKELIEQHLKCRLERSKEMISIKELWDEAALVIGKHYSVSDLLSLLPKDLSRLIPQFEHLTTLELVRYINTFRSFNNARYLYGASAKVKASISYVEASLESQGDISLWEGLTQGDFSKESICCDHVDILKEPHLCDLGKILNKKISDIIF